MRRNRLSNICFRCWWCCGWWWWWWWCAWAI